MTDICRSFWGFQFECFKVCRKRGICGCGYG